MKLIASLMVAGSVAILCYAAFLTLLVAGLCEQFDCSDRDLPYLLIGGQLVLAIGLTVLAVDTAVRSFRRASLTQNRFLARLFGFVVLVIAWGAIAQP